jgi:HK97 gp10 family phage protein
MLKIKLLNIASEFSRIKEESQKISREGLQKSAVRMVSDLKSVTPVDTGNARDSWSAVTTPVSVDIQNTAEYMKYLNAGSSKQAPAFFIEATALKYGKPVGPIVEEV